MAHLRHHHPSSVNTGQRDPSHGPLLPVHTTDTPMNSPRGDDEDSGHEAVVIGGVRNRGRRGASKRTCTVFGCLKVMVLVSLGITGMAAVYLASQPDFTSPVAKGRVLIARQLKKDVPPKHLKPFMIHQMYKTCDASELPPHWRNSPAAWKAAFPEATYKCWTDAELRAFVARKAPWFMPTFDAYPYNIQRIDSSRYFVLHEFGGLYADMDIQPLPNITNIIRWAFQPLSAQRPKSHHAAVEIVSSAHSTTHSELPSEQDIRNGVVTGGMIGEDGEQYLEAVLFSSTFQAWFLPPSGRITNAIMIAPQPNSRFFAEVINGLQASYQTTPNLFYYMYILTSAGSRYVNLRYLDAAAERPGGVGLLDVEVSRTRLEHVQGNSWHQKDMFGQIADRVRPLISGSSPQEPETDNKT